VSKSGLTSVASNAGPETHTRARFDAPLKQEPFATSVAGAVKLCGGAVGRSSIYKAMQRGELRFRKAGARRVILIAELREWLQNLPSETENVRFG
jgi:hypothetical protein